MNILVYTPQHTGTWFLINLIKTASKSHFVLTDADACSRGAKIDPLLEKKYPFAYIDDKILSPSSLYGFNFGHKWLQERFLDSLTPEELQSEIIIFHCHIKQPNSPFVRSIGSNERCLNIASSMRDPLLAIQTLIWRQYGTYKNFYDSESPYTRIGRAYIHVQRILNILSLKSKYSCSLLIATLRTKY